MFSKTCEYAIRSSIYIGAQSTNGQRVSLSDVAQKIESPEAFTSKILQKLVKNKIIQSIKGPGGGFMVDPKMMEQIKLYQIIKVFEGDVLRRCSLGLNECSDTFPCPFHSRYKPVREKLKNIFEETTLNDMVKGLYDGNTFLKL
ncbi:MAG: Rrf2 family transcriptional regulator [Saprospiraceae bacterium]